MPENHLRKIPSLSIALHRELHTGQWYVACVDYDTSLMKNKTRFKAPMPIEQVFTRSFLDQIDGYLPTRATPNVLSDSDRDLTLGGLQLSGIRVVAQKAIDGLQSVVIRFREVIGLIHELYDPSLRLDRPGKDKISFAEKDHPSTAIATENAPLLT